MKSSIILSISYEFQYDNEKKGFHAQHVKFFFAWCCGVAFSVHSFNEARAVNGLFNRNQTFCKETDNFKYLEQNILAGSDIWMKYKAIGAIGIKSFEMLETLVEFKHEHLIMISTNHTKCASAIWYRGLDPICN